MKRLLLIGVLLAGISASVSSQSNVTGRWRGLVMLPGADGPPPEIALDLKGDGTSVTGTITGPPATIRDGRIEGDTLTLNLNNANGQPTSDRRRSCRR